MEAVILSFFLGIAVGSFLNVVVLRHEKRKQVTGRSKCPTCGTQLQWVELVPVFSYVFQRGKCRHCETKLSIQYPLVELGCGILFVLVYFHGIPYESVHTKVLLILELTIWSLFLVIAVYDLRTKLIPNVFSFTLAGLACVHMFVSSGSELMPTITHLLAGPILFVPFYLLWKISDGMWLGLGDGKLALGIGWFLGLSGGATAILFSFWIGAGVSLLLIAIARLLRSNKSTLTLKSEVPFGPFMVLATLIVYIFEYNLFLYVL